MIGYYFRLALFSLRRNAMLTALMIAAIALGIGAAMTSLTVLRAMSGNPLAHKEGLVYRPQLDNWAPGRAWNDDDPNDLPSLFTYRDAMALYDARQAKYQAAMFPNVLPVEPANEDVKPYLATVLFTHGEMFPMFDTPFLFGGGWDREQDRKNARVVVLSRATNERLFGGEDSTGRSIKMGGEEFTVVGVLDRWNPQPKYYEPSSGGFAEAEEMYVPFGNGIERELQSSNNNSCWKDPGNGYPAWLQSDCVWMAFWVELADSGDRAQYLSFINNYVTEQKKLGRFERPLNNQLSTTGEWLVKQQVVPNDARTQVWLSFAFLLVCLINTVGLLLAKFMARASEIGLRRAVGASKREVFAQYLTESGVVGVVGALCGLLLTWLGLVALRTLYGDADVGVMARLDAGMTAVTVVVALVASLLAGLYPTWRACGVTPATQLKSN
jgi:putative ABC transport system permease protein